MIQCWIYHVIYCILNSKCKTERLCGYRMVVSVSVVYPCDFVAGWELWLVATAQHPERVLCCMLHVTAWEKIKIQSSKYYFYWMHIAFTPLWTKKFYVGPSEVRDCIYTSFILVLIYIQCLYSEYIMSTFLLVNIENSEKIAMDMNKCVFIEIETQQPNKHKVSNN